MYTDAWLIPGGKTLSKRLWYLFLRTSTRFSTRVYSTTTGDLGANRLPGRWIHSNFPQNGRRTRERWTKSSSHDFPHLAKSQSLLFTIFSELHDFQAHAPRPTEKTRNGRNRTCRVVPVLSCSAGSLFTALLSGIKFFYVSTRIDANGAAALSHPAFGAGYSSVRSEFAKTCRQGGELLETTGGRGSSRKATAKVSRIHDAIRQQDAANWSRAELRIESRANSSSTTAAPRSGRNASPRLPFYPLVISRRSSPQPKIYRTIWKPVPVTSTSTIR